MARRIATGTAVTCLAVASMIGTTGCASGGPSTASVLPQHRSYNPNAGPYDSVSPAKLVGGNAGPYSSSVLWPDTSGWTVQGHRGATWVTAGGDADHPSVGLFGILRTDPINAKQTTDFVRVPGVGPLTITKAPQGRAVADRAQKRGKIEFTSRSGATGALHLREDTVTLNP